MPLSSERPVTPTDLNITPPEEAPVVNVVMDGNVMQDNLKFTGNNEKWLQKQLHAQGVTKLSEVFLATCDIQNTLTVYVKITKPMTRDEFS